MQKPNNYDDTQVSGSFTPVELGGHICTIKKVAERKNKNNGDMVVVLYDFATSDKQSGYFMKSFKDDIRPDKKWPHAGTAYINVEDGAGKCSKAFKTFITSVEASNKGFVTKWGEDFCSQFAGKTIGAVFGEVENEYNGKVTMRHERRWFCSADAAKEAAIPDPKYLNGNAPKKEAPKPAASSFMDVSSDDEEIPFD